MRSFNQKRCFITGAASGIGRALAEATAREGAELYLTDINEPLLNQVVEQIRKDGGMVKWSGAMDVSDYEQVREAARQIYQEHGSMDAVMNVAGISVWGSVRNLRHDQWRRCVDINLMGPIHVIECFIPAMIDAKRGGYLVNVSSAAGLFGLPWHAAYSASKFGLRGVSEVLRYDLERYRIGVSLVCPGGVDTGLVQTLEIEGVNAQHPSMLKMKENFRKHAKTPEQAAAAIIRGVKARRYMVFTSFDIRMGYWFQRKFAWPYEWVMRIMNYYLHKIMSRAQAG